MKRVKTLPMNYNIERTSSLANTLSAIMGVHPVKGGTEELFDFVSKVGSIDRCVLFHPLLVGQALFEGFSALKDKVELICDERLELVAPYGGKGINSLLSMYSGDENGKGKESLFDKLVKEKKRCVVVLPKKYRRQSSFFPVGVEVQLYDVPMQGLSISLSLIKANNYDFIVLVDSDYAEESLLSGPSSRSALKAVQRQIEDFTILANAVEVFWRNKRALVGFCPDRGVHRTLLWGRSGSKRVEDLNVLHYFSVKEGSISD